MLSSTTTLLLLFQGTDAQTDSRDVDWSHMLGEEGLYSDLFTDDEYDEMTTKRVRAEIRDISDDQWDRVANAMNIMKNLSEVDGQAMYGDYYRNYDNLVCQHAVASFGEMG